MSERENTHHRKGTRHRGVAKNLATGGAKIIDRKPHLLIHVAVRGRGRLSQIGASRNPFRSTSTAKYSAVVFVAMSSLSSSNLKFARFLYCACSVSTPGSLAPICDNRPRSLTAGVVDCHSPRESQSVQCRKSESAGCLGPTLSMRNEENARTSNC